MSQEEIQQLEILLNKMVGVVGGKFGVWPNYNHDGFHIEIYDQNGVAKTGITAPTLSDCFKHIEILES